MPAKGDIEVVYGAPWKGVDYSKPINLLDQNSLAPGTVNTSQSNGFLTSSPWVGSSPYATSFSAGEFILGNTQYNSLNATGVVAPPFHIIVTNKKVYITSPNLTQGATISQPSLNVLHTWNAGTELTSFTYPGAPFAFLQINGILYMTSSYLSGIFYYNGTTFGQATPYVNGQYMFELGGRMCVASCYFPTGGGPAGFAGIQPTIAWSGVGIYGQAYDGNPAHDVWNPANQAFFSGNIGGFNLLSDVPDLITGTATIGRSALIFRQNGITQQDPNAGYSNSGVQPFIWYHLWSSPQGVGAYPGTVAQFGQTILFRSSDNVYSMSLSGGINPVGSKIIDRIRKDQRLVENTTAMFQPNTGVYVFYENWWNTASIIDTSGQLHYLLTFNAWTATPAAPPSTTQAICYMYDYSVAEDSWHVVDFSQYFQQSGQGAGFLGFSTPISQIYESMNQQASNQGTTQALPSHLYFGAFTSYGTPLVEQLNGGIFFLYPFSYDATSSVLTSFISPLYPVLSVPQTKVVFRAEIISLGHKITFRRLRIQSDNAPMPTIVANAQQTALVTVTGVSGPPVTCPTIQMAGNAPKSNGLQMNTDYGSVVFTDELVQASIQSVVASTTNPWQSMAMFRLSNVSMIAVDATGTQQ